MTAAWQATVISESLAPETALNTLRVRDARVTARPRLHLYRVEADDDEIEAVRRLLHGGPWPARFHRADRTLLVWSAAVFEIDGPDAEDETARALAFAARRGLTAADLALLDVDWNGPDTLRAAPADTPAHSAPAATGPHRDPDGTGPARGPVAATRLVLADDDVHALLDVVEDDVLRPLAFTHTPAALPDPGALLAAARRIRERLWTPVAPVRVLAPGGRWVHQGLRLVRVADADVDLLHAALTEMSGCLAEDGGDLYDPERAALAGALTRIAADAATTPAALTGALARLLAVVDLPPDDDTRTLAAALAAAPAPDGGPDLVLDDEQERAFQRVAHRITMLLTEAEPLHRFLTDPKDDGTGTTHPAGGPGTP